MKILAAVVTHNRLSLLKRCLEHIQAQTRAPDGLLVIDHESTDGTKQYLVERHVNHITQENGGASAGWARGIEEAHASDYDYIWLMDDDGYPGHKSLEILSANLDSSCACVSSVVIKENAHDELVFALPILNKRGFPTLLSLTRKYYSLSEARIHTPSWKYPFAHLFNGALINLSLARKIGNVERRYFIYGEELDYLWRLKKVGRVETDLQALHYHPDVSNRRFNHLKVYYIVRNTIIVNYRYLDAPFVRSALAIMVLFVRIARRNGIREMLSYLFSGNVRYVFFGLIDSLTNRMIRRF